MPTQSGGRSAALGAAALYIGLVLVCLYPQSLRPLDTVGYVGDSLDTVYFMAWNAHQAVRDPLHLFDANILHPHRETMALAGHRILLGLLTAPVQWASGNPILAYNLALAAAYLFAAWVGRHLALALGLEPIGAFAAGALYAFNTYQINEAPRADLLYHPFTFLALAELVRHLRGGPRRHAWTAALLMLLQGLCANYLLLYGALLLGIVTVAALVARPRVVAPRLLPLALAGVCAGVLFLPVILPQVRSARTYGFTREAPEGVDLRHFVSTLPSNVVYGERGARVRPQQKAAHFVGFVSLALALVGLVAHRRLAATDSLLPARLWAPSSAALAALFVWLSLGRDVVAWGHGLGPGPYRLVHAYVPGFAFIRIPERLSLLALFFVALLVGAGITFLRARFGTVAAVVLAGLVPLEHVSPLGLQERMPVGRDVPQVYRWLAADRARAVGELPVWGEGLIRKETVQEYFSTYHFKPIVHGYVSYPPLLSVLLRRAADEAPSERAHQVLQRCGVDTLVVHLGRAGSEGLDTALAAAAAEGRLRREARFDGADAHPYLATADEVWRLLPVPRLPAAPQPSGRAVRDPAWRWSARVGDAAAAGDGDPKTSWTVPGELRGDEWLAVEFGSPLRIAGVAIPLRRESVFPTGLRLEGRNQDGTWRRLARLDDEHVLQLVDQLLVTPGGARLGFDLGGRGDVSGVRLLPAEGARGFEGWSIAELEVWVP